MNDSRPAHAAPDDLDRLLDRAPLPEPDAWFAARTLARCRNEAPAGFSLAPLWRWALGGGLGVCLAAFTIVHLHQPVPAPVDQQDVQDAFAILASADSDPDSSATASTLSWPDSSP